MPGWLGTGDSTERGYSRENDSCPLLEFRRMPRWTFDFGTGKSPGGGCSRENDSCPPKKGRRPKAPTSRPGLF